VSAVEQPHITDALHERAVGLRCELIQHGIASLAVADSGAHFDQFVRTQRHVEFVHHVG
jgi:hypothetical protein